MSIRARTFTAVACILFGSSRELGAGSIHIRYGADAPEKMAAANEIYYGGVLNLYHNHTEVFEHNRHFYTRMFNDTEVMDKLLARWEAHEQRFEYWHDCLWKVLDGYRASHESLPHFSQILSISGGSTEIVPGGISPESVSPGSGGGGGDGGHVHVQDLPEPSTGVMMISVLIVGLLGFIWRCGIRGLRAGKLGL